MKKRDVIVVILLGLFTCGIYHIYWFYVTAEEMNKKDESDKLMNYILAVLLGIVTCSIYMYYWLYKFYKKLDNMAGTSNLTLSFLLSIFATPIAGMAISQSTINEKLL